MAWGFATAGSSDELLFAALASPAEQNIGEFILLDLANTVWAFSAARRLSPQLYVALATIARASEQHVGEFSA